MAISHKMKQLLSPTNNVSTFEDFRFDFYRKLRTYNIGYTPNSFDDFLEVLYSLDEETYKNVLENLKNISYGFVKNNPILVINLISNGLSKDIMIACKMIEVQNQIIARHVFRVDKSMTDGEKKSVLLNIERKLKLLKSEGDDNIVTLAQTEFTSIFSSVKENENLRGLYNQILDEFPIKMFDKLIGRKNKVNNDMKEIIDGRLRAHEAENAYFNTKDRNARSRRNR